MNTSVSVIIPCYNAEKYIQKCMDSFENQKFMNYEIICVDDGSTDNTVTIIDNYIKKNHRIHLIKQNNQFAGVARNNGLKSAKGKYVLFFDSDDFCDENMLAEMVASAEKYNSDIVVCDVQTYDNQTGKYDKHIPYFRESFVCDYEKRGTISYRDIPNEILLLASSGPWNKLYRRDFIMKEKLIFQNSRRDNDEYFILMSMALAERISWVSKKFVTYRVNNPYSLQGFGEKGIDTEDLISAIRALRDGLKEKNRYELLKKSFQNQVLVRYVGLIESQRSWANFKKVFDFTKTTVFPEFGINKMASLDVFMRAEERKRILENDAEEYLFWKMKKMEAGNGERYIFPYHALNDSKKIALYGAGTVGKSYYKQIQEDERICLVGWYDRNYANYNYEMHIIESPESILPAMIEKIIIAIESQEIATKIKKYLLKKGFQEKDIIWDI